MCKFAATVLALALATTHGLLDEGGPIVQKDAPKGLRGDAQADSSPRAAVGRKLEFGYFKTKTNQPTAEPTAEPTAVCPPCTEFETLDLINPVFEDDTSAHRAPQPDHELSQR